MMRTQVVMILLAAIALGKAAIPGFAVAAGRHLEPQMVTIHDARGAVASTIRVPLNEAVNGVEIYVDASLLQTGELTIRRVAGEWRLEITRADTGRSDWEKTKKWLLWIARAVAGGTVDG
jgi:hypothetical protein